MAEKRYEKRSARMSVHFPRREELMTAWDLMQNDICMGLEVTVKDVSHANEIASHMTRARGLFASMLVTREKDDIYKIVLIW